MTKSEILNTDATTSRVLFCKGEEYPVMAYSPFINFVTCLSKDCLNKYSHEKANSIPRFKPNKV